MNEDEFIDDCVNEIFARGLIPPYEDEVLEYLYGQYDDIESIPAKADFIEKCIDHFDLTTVGASHYWLAVHEAGHAIVGLKFGLPLRGVRFHDGGKTGVAVFRDPERRRSKDETIIRKLIEVDVAGNMAQIVYPGCEAPIGGHLSDLYVSDLRPGEHGDKYPSDFWLADNKAHALLYGSGDTPASTDRNTWPAKRAILKEAEAEAEKLLRCELETLKRLSAELLKGPMKGTAVKQIVDGGDS